MTDGCSPDLLELLGNKLPTPQLGVERVKLQSTKDPVYGAKHVGGRWLTLQAAQPLICVPPPKQLHLRQGSRPPTLAITVVGTRSASKGMANTPRQSEVALDGRRRTSLAKVGRKQDHRYVAETFEDGTIVLSPAITVTRVELAALGDAEIRTVLQQARQASRKDLRSRGSFAAHGED